VTPDLITLEVLRPELNGFDVAAVLRHDPQTMRIPIMIISIFLEGDPGRRIVVDRYLTKPIESSDLLAHSPPPSPTRPASWRLAETPCLTSSWPTPSSRTGRGSSRSCVPSAAWQVSCSSCSNESASEKVP